MKTSQFYVTLFIIIIAILLVSKPNFGSTQIYVKTEENSLISEEDNLLSYKLAFSEKSIVITNEFPFIQISEIDHDDPLPPPPDTLKSVIPEYQWMEK